MTICNPGDIVIIPFLFTDSSKAKPRPALVISMQDFNKTHSKSLMLMITTAKRSQWPSDTAIKHLSACGLHTDSSVRLKCFTMDNRLIKSRIGHMAKSDWAAVKKKWVHIVAL